ncbi:MAG: hypothetical protein JO326_03815 [Acetobacteraceae bacterium]|nr:hypothetical protein [Acetobacteraceae bacterium]
MRPLLGRNFTADRPDQVWLADISFIATDEGWLYLALKFLDSGRDFGSKFRRLAGFDATRRVQRRDKTGDALRRKGFGVATRRVRLDPLRRNGC